MDVSGDGSGGEGFGPSPASAHFPSAAGVAWFRVEVPHGAGAFSTVAKDCEDHAEAMEAKLLRVLARPRPAALGPGRPSLAVADTP